MRGSGLLAWLACSCAMLSGRPLSAQVQLPVALASSPRGIPLRSVSDGSTAPVVLGAARPDAPAPWWAPVLSGVVPGAGQFVLGQQRSVGYLVAEGYLLLQQVRARRDADRDREAYRALAFEVARARFGGERPRGSWDYYESMEEYLESGAFDRLPGGAIDPETDESTYNGARWLLARETYWLDPAVPPVVGSPEYQRALAFYQARAVPDAYRWSWRDARLQQDVYAQTIASANRSVQRAVNYAGLIGANHLVSLIDAYVSVRIRRYGGAGVGGLSVESVRTAVEPVGDPRDGRRQWRTGIRLVPTAR